MYYWLKEKAQRSVEQNSSEINPHIYGQSFHDKNAKNIQWRKDSLFKKLCWENWTATLQKNETVPFSFTIQKINSNGLKT